MSKRFPSFIRRRLSVNAGLVVCSLLLFFAGTEALLRICGYGNLELYDPDPEAFWVLRPNQDCVTKIGRYPVHINNLGYRDDDFAVGLPSGTPLIFVFGDSATYGWGVPQEATFSEQLERRLGHGAQVVNGGVNAYSMFQEEIAFRRALKFKPDLAVIAFPFNDSWQDLEILDQHGKQRVLGGVLWKNRLRRFASFHAFGEIQLRFIYDRIRRDLMSVDSGGSLEPRLRRFIDALARIDRLSKEAGVPLLLVQLPKKGLATPNAFQAAMRDFAGVHDLHLVIVPPRDGDWFLANDDIHPSIRGHSEIGEMLATAVAGLGEFTQNH